MNATLSTETCQIVWWKGYVKGRFVALLEPDSRPTEVLGESPAVRWRGSEPPEPTEAAVQALGSLTDTLVASGWTLGEPRPDAWFSLVLWRPATQSAREETHVDQREVAELRPAPEARRELQAVTNLRSELLHALDEVERERRLRLEAQERARREQLNAPARQPAAAGRGHPLRVAAELAVVVLAAALAFVALDSAYASVVAGLTASAMVLGLDSMFAVRR